MHEKKDLNIEIGKRIKNAREAAGLEGLSEKQFEIVKNIINNVLEAFSAGNNILP